MSYFYQIFIVGPLDFQLILMFVFDVKSLAIWQTLVLLCFQIQTWVESTMISGAAECEVVAESDGSDYSTVFHETD